MDNQNKFRLAGLLLAFAVLIVTCAWVYDVATTVTKQWVVTHQHLPR